MSQKTGACCNRACIEWGKREGSNLLGLTIYEISREWRGLLDQRLKPLGLSNSRWMALKAVEFLGGSVSQKQIADEMGVEGPTLVRALDQLEKDGWVQRRVSKQDRRVKLVSLLPKADLLLERITQTCFEVQREVLDGLDENELGTCHATLLHLRSRIYELSGKKE
ncbi:MAG: MarR family winged helix-turn-helix transcriptional regulator [Desulfovibrio sp.]